MHYELSQTLQCFLFTSNVGLREELIPFLCILIHVRMCFDIGCRNVWPQVIWREIHQFRGIDNIAISISSATYTSHGVIYIILPKFIHWWSYSLHFREGGGRSDLSTTLIPLTLIIIPSMTIITNTLTTATTPLPLKIRRQSSRKYSRNCSWTWIGIDVYIIFIS